MSSSILVTGGAGYIGSHVVQQAAVGKRETAFIYGTDYDTPEGTGVRDYIHVADLSRAHLDALNYLRWAGPRGATHLELIVESALAWERHLSGG